MHFDKFIAKLGSTCAGRRSFNPWRDYDKTNDYHRTAPELRRENLREYLNRCRNAKVILLGEAPGYCGCKFSGIPFTDEAMAEDYLFLNWLRPTSNRDSSRWQEKSARVVWPQLGTKCHEVVLWNAYPFHPYEGSKLSNRTPTAKELKRHLKILQSFLALFPDATIFAIGRSAEKALTKLQKNCTLIRHPAYGGQSEFQAGIQSNFKHIFGSTYRPLKDPAYAADSLFEMSL